VILPKQMLKMLPKRFALIVNIMIRYQVSKILIRNPDTIDYSVISMKAEMEHYESWKRQNGEGLV
jgi:hypothetical protein